MLFALFQINALAQSKDEENKNTSEEPTTNSKNAAQTPLAVNKNDEVNVDLSFWFAPVPAMREIDSLEDSTAASTQAPFSTMFKYNTSPSEPEHRCYEITKPISKEVTFLFNFVSQSKFTNGRRVFIR
ncbi:hypothetical protein GWN90_26945 [candidate division KSB1 bacterium]|nr:hypothetical protein [candidate division KSB1 bacterium]